MTEKDIELILRKKFLTDFLSDSFLKKTGDELAKVLLQIQRDRTTAGYDIYGRQFGGYNKSYNKIKAMSYASKKYGTISEFQGNTAMSGKRTPLRLTGHLFAGMTVKYIGNSKSGSKVVFRFKFSVIDSEKKKAEGLMSETGTARGGKTYAKKSWMFMGLSVSGSQLASEQTKIKKSIQNNAKLAFEKVKQ